MIIQRNAWTRFQVEDEDLSRFNSTDSFDFESYSKEIGLDDILLPTPKVGRPKSDLEKQYEQQPPEAISALREMEEENLRADLKTVGAFHQDTVTISAKTSAVVLENDIHTQELIRLIGGTENFESIYSLILRFYDPIMKVATTKKSLDEMEFVTPEGQKAIKKAMRQKYNPDVDAKEVVFNKHNWNLEYILAATTEAQDMTAYMCQKKYGKYWGKIIKKYTPDLINSLIELRAKHGMRLFHLFLNLIKLGNLNHINSYCTRSEQVPLVNFDHFNATQQERATFNKHIFEDFSLAAQKKSMEYSNLRSFAKPVSAVLYNICDHIKYYIKQVSLKKRNTYVAVGTKSSFYMVADSHPFPKQFTFDQNVAPTHICIPFKSRINQQSNKLLDLMWFEHNKLFKVFALKNAASANTEATASAQV